MSSFWLGILEQGLMYGIMVLGVYITYKLLDFPDLTVDGSFALGASAAAALLVAKVNPFAATAVSVLCGMASGAVTGILHVKFKITNLLSGILVMIGLYSVNLRIMGKSNIPLFNYGTIFVNGVPPIVIIAIYALVIKFALDFFLKTKMGFVLRAVGDNPQMVTSLGVDTGKIKILGLMLSNGLVALSGAITAQYQGFSDVGMGTGTIVVGLAAIIFGEAIFKKFTFIKATATALAGSVLYKASLALALELGFPPTDLKLITAIIVTAALAVNQSGLGLRLKNMLSNGGGQIASNSKSIQNIQ